MSPSRQSSTRTGPSPACCPVLRHGTHCPRGRPPSRRVRRTVIVDTSALLAFFDRNEPDHAAVAGVVAATTDALVVAPYVLAELDYLVATRHGVDAELAVLAGSSRAAPGTCPGSRPTTSRPHAASLSATGTRRSASRTHRSSCWPSGTARVRCSPWTGGTSTCFGPSMVAGFASSLKRRSRRRPMQPAGRRPCFHHHEHADDDDDGHLRHRARPLRGPLERSRDHGCAAPPPRRATRPRDRGRHRRAPVRATRDRGHDRDPRRRIARAARHPAR